VVLVVLLLANMARPSGLDSPAVAKFKTQFGVVFLDNGIGTPGCRYPFDNGTDTMLDCHAHRSHGAALVKAAKKSTVVFTYRQISAYLEGNSVDDPALMPLWLKKDDAGNAVKETLDWRKPEAVKWYVDNVIGEHTAADKNFNGIFIDGPIASSQKCCDANMTLKSKQELFLGVAKMLKQATVLLGKHGKVLTASLGSRYANLSEFYPAGSGMPQLCAADAAPSSMEACCAFGEEKFYKVIGGNTDKQWFTPFRQFNIPSRDFGDASHGGNDTLGCAAAVENAAAEMLRGGGFYCNNDGWPNATDGGVQISRHTVSLAAYLMGAQKDSYFSSGLHWADLVPAPNPNAGEKAWPIWPDYKKKLGAPKGAYKRDGFVFTRSFEHADAKLDCGQMTAAVTWKK